MQRPEVSGAVRHIYTCMSLGGKGFKCISIEVLVAVRCSVSFSTAEHRSDSTWRWNKYVNQNYCER
jgi:hypothetical protein